MTMPITQFLPLVVLVALALPFYNFIQTNEG